MSRPVDLPAAPAGSNGVLLFAQVEGGRPPRIFPPFWGKSAYERFQIPFYLEELIALRAARATELTPEFLALTCAVEVLSRTRQGLEFEELGSTLFSSIDKLEILLGKHGLKADSRAIEFRGIEVMPLMVWLAEALHPAHRLVHRSAAGRSSAPRGVGLTRCYQASSYAFSSTEELVEWTSSSLISGQGVFFSRGASDQSVDLMGNRLTLFSLPDFHAAMTRRGFTLIPLRSGSLLYDDVVDCEETYFLAHRFDQAERQQVADLYSRLRAPEDVLIEWDRHAAIEEMRPLGPPRPRSFGFRQIAAAPSSDPTLNFSDPALFDSFLESLAMAARHPGLFVTVEDLGPVFERELGFCWTHPLPALAHRSDTGDHNNRSDFTLLEDGVPLGPRHSNHIAIRAQGGGRLSHWNTHLYFSTSDNSDPNTNGRRYTLAKLDR